MNHFLILLAFLILLTGCRHNSTTEAAKPLEINPVYKSATTQNEIIKTITTSTNSEWVPKISLNPNDILIDLIDTNLDIDSHDEQILIVKNNLLTDSPLRIIVADFDNILNSYSISWESETNSNNVRSFLINFTDITGDHNLEIVCSGTDLDGKETLNIFRRTHSEGDFVINYSEIIDLKIDGNIEIKEKKRTQAYQTGISEGISFPIIVTTTDPLSENILDLIQKTYFWRNTEAQYRLISEDKIPGDEIENIKLKEFYRNDKDYFITFLTGPWMLSNSDANPSYNNPFVFFDTKNERILFSNNYYQEIYIWKTSSKTLSNTLLITFRNELVPHIEGSFSVQVIDTNNINLKFRDNSIRNNRNTENQLWTGNYFKLNTEIQRDLIKNLHSGTDESNIPVLSGYYKSDTNDEIFFDTPYYTLKTNDVITNGGFYFFDNGLKIAEFKTLNENNLVQNTLSYKYDFFEELSESEIIRTIILISGDMTITGLIPNGEYFKRFIQIEQIEISE